jgi:hypothetical protein
VLATSGAIVVSMAEPATLERRPAAGELDADEVERVARLLDDDAQFVAALAALSDETVEPYRGWPCGPASGARPAPGRRAAPGAWPRPRSRSGRPAPRTVASWARVRPWARVRHEEVP